MSNVHPVFKDILDRFTTPVECMTGARPAIDAALLHAVNTEAAETPTTVSAFAAETECIAKQADELTETLLGGTCEDVVDPSRAQPFRSMHAEDGPSVAAEMGAQVRRCEAATLARMGDLTNRPHIENAEQLRGYLLRLGIYVLQAGIDLDQMCVGDGDKALMPSMLQKISDAARMIDRAADSVIDVPMEPLDEEALAEARADANRRYMEQLRKGA